MKLDTLIEGNAKKSTVRTKTLSQFFTFLIFQVIHIDRGQFEKVNFYLSLWFLMFMRLVFICLLQNQNNYD